MIAKRTLQLAFLISLGLAVVMIGLFFTRPVAAKEDNLTYKFNDIDEDYYQNSGPDYIELEFEGQEEYEIRVDVVLKNVGEETVNYTFYGFEESDLSPNPNDEENEKMEIQFSGRNNQELDARRQITLSVAIALSDELYSYEDPYTLELHFRNEDARKSKTMFVNMTILPVYELDIVDSDGNTTRDMDAGDSLEVELLLRNYGNREDDVDITVEADDRNISVSVKEPSGGSVEGLAPLILDDEAYERVTIVIEAGENMESGKYNVTVEGLSLGDLNGSCLERYILNITGKEKPGAPLKGGEDDDELFVLPGTAPVVVGTVVAGTLLLFFFGTEAGRFLFFPLLFPLYTRLRREDVLSDFNRGQLFGCVKTSPGITLGDIRRALHIPNGTAIYHLKVLERERYLKSRRDGVNRRFYPWGMQVRDDDFHPTEIQAQIIDTIKEWEAISQTDIANQLGLPRETVHYHVKKLRAADVVEMVKHKGAAFCSLSEDWE